MYIEFLFVGSRIKGQLQDQNLRRKFSKHFPLTPYTRLRYSFSFHIMVLPVLIFGEFSFIRYCLPLTCLVPPKHRRTRVTATCRPGSPAPPTWPPRATPRGPTGAAGSIASPPPKMPPTTSATSLSCNLCGTSLVFYTSTC